MTDASMDSLVKALLEGDQAGALAETKRLRSSEIGCERIVTEGVEAAMANLDEKCTVEQFNLLEIMLAGRAVMGVVRELYPPSNPPLPTKGTVILGTPEGDVHDLGKNILKAVLTAKRYRVVDCGKDCPIETMIAAAEQENALAMAVSGLITAVIPQVRSIRERMKRRGLGSVRLIAGGAALKQGSAGSLNVDFVAESAFDGLHYLEEITGGDNERH